MKVDKKPGAWSRRDLVRVGGMATAAGMMGAIGPAEAAGATPRPLAVPPPADTPEVYTRIGVRPFINLTGTLTINGGALTLPEVREASGRAAAHAVDLDELMEKVGARIAELLGSEGAIVTSGAAAALTHATAACVAGADPELIQQLPDLTGLKDEVIIPRESRNVYDHAFRTLGVRMVEVETLEQFHAALGHRTAMVAVLGTGEARGPMRLEQIVAAARQAGVPVTVDAAAELPMKPNPYLSRGADHGRLQRRQDIARPTVCRIAPRQKRSRVGGLHERRAASRLRPDDEGGQRRSHGHAGGSRGVCQSWHRAGLPEVEVMAAGNQRSGDQGRWRQDPNAGAGGCQPISDDVGRVGSAKGGDHRGRGLRAAARR